MERFVCFVRHLVVKYDIATFANRLKVPFQQRLHKASLRPKLFFSSYLYLRDTSASRFRCGRKMQLLLWSLNTITICLLFGLIVSLFISSSSVTINHHLQVQAWTFFLKLHVKDKECNFKYNVSGEGSGKWWEFWCLVCKQQCSRINVSGWCGQISCSSCGKKADYPEVCVCVCVCGGRLKYGVTQNEK